MYAKPIALFLLSILLGCRNELVLINDGGGPDGVQCPSQPDLLTPTAKCAAAKGLPGEVLGDLCIDMDKIDTQGLKDRGFNLTASNISCMGWEVAGGKLQPTGVNTSLGNVTCTTTLPSIPIATKYSRIMLAVVQQASIPVSTQQARIQLFNAPPLDLWLNPSAEIDQRTVVEIDTSRLTSGPDMQTILQLIAPKSTSTPMWTISSIAVLGQLSQ